MGEERGNSNGLGTLLRKAPQRMHILVLKEEKVPAEEEQGKGVLVRALRLEKPWLVCGHEDPEGGAEHRVG